MDDKKNEILFTGSELNLIYYAMKTTPEMTNTRLQTGEVTLAPVPRKFDDEQLGVVLRIFEKMRSHFDLEKKKYIDSEIEFNTEEKALLLSLIKRPWELEDGVIKETLKIKLEK